MRPFFMVQFFFDFFDWLVRRVKIWLVGLAGLLVGSI